jgi:hypothetical protein
MKRMRNFLLFMMCSVPSVGLAFSFTTQVTPASIRSGATPFEFDVTPVADGFDVSFSTTRVEGDTHRFRASLCSVTITEKPARKESPKSGVLEKMGGKRTKVLRNIALKEDDGKTFATFTIESELLRDKDLAFVFVVSPYAEENGKPVLFIHAAFYNFYIRAFLPQTLTR